MDEIITQQDIKNLILTVRGTQVLLDSDVAMLYGYETKKINQSASRNKERFPERFRFLLTQDEYDHILSLRSQLVTLKRGQHRKYTPYVYTEQGIAMLSGILRNETAVRVSLGIMDAFVEMRRFISVYGKAFERISTVEYRLIEHDKKFDELFDLIQAPNEFSQGIFFKGQIYDAFKLIMDIVRSAEKSIVIIDNYADGSVLDMLTEKKANVAATIITAKPSRITNITVDKFNTQYPELQVLKSTDFHDRFIIVDGSILYHVGASLKDAGKKCFAISVLENENCLRSIMASTVLASQNSGF